MPIRRAILLLPAWLAPTLVAWLALSAAVAAAEVPAPTPKAIRSDLGQGAPEPAPSPFGFLGPRRIDGLKAGVAGAGAGLLLWGAALARAGRPGAARRPRDAVLAALGLLALACWWNLGRFHFDHHAHRSDSYVHFLGARYFHELGYDLLYHCTAVAEAEAGRADRIAGRGMRDLRRNELVRAAAALADREACKRHFSPERWSAFRRDVEWFRGHMPPGQWLRAQMDHGYNATPAWGILGIPLAGAGPASESRLRALALIDPLFLAIAWGALAWAFGWRATCVAALFWGTNPFAHFGWVGGGLLRQDWLLATVLSLCLLRRQRPAAAGFALAVAGLLRVFPALLFAGLGLLAATAMLRERSLRPPGWALRAGAGAALAVALLVPLSVAVAGAGAWPEFAVKLRVHRDTPLQNAMGLAVLLAHDPAASADDLYHPGAGDPFGRWKQARRAAFESRRPLFYALLVGFGLLFARAVDRRSPWEAAALGVGWIPMATAPTCYYYSVLLCLGPLWLRRQGIGVGLSALSAAGWLFASRWHATDEVFALSSAAVLAFVLYATAALARGDPSPAAPPLRPG